MSLPNYISVTIKLTAYYNCVKKVLQHWHALDKIWSGFWYIEVKLCHNWVKTVPKWCPKHVTIVSEWRNNVVRSVSLLSHKYVIIQSKSYQISLIWRQCTAKTESKTYYLNCVKSILHCCQQHVTTKSHKCHDYVGNISLLCQLCTIIVTILRQMNVASQSRKKTSNANCLGGWIGKDDDFYPRGLRFKSPHWQKIF